MSYPKWRVALSAVLVLALAMVAGFVLWWAYNIVFVAERM